MSFFLGCICCLFARGFGAGTLYPKSRQNHPKFSQMTDSLSPHTFHIPVMGLGYTVDTPIKTAHLGISSVISIMDDHLLEEMRRIYSEKFNKPYQEIPEEEEDSRAKRITAFLNLTQVLVTEQLEAVQSSQSLKEPAFQQYLQLLPPSHPMWELVQSFEQASGEGKEQIHQQILNLIQAGNIDVNIMTKVDKLNYDKKGNALPREFSDALSALRGFAKSNLTSSVVFSAGLNPALYSYAEQFGDFFPDEKGVLRKKIILKVSDYRSALIQGKFLAKKGLWVSEFRIESGLNCGGHAFATEGFLIGPILEEFKGKRTELTETLFQSCNQVWTEKGNASLQTSPRMKITYQGGLGTQEEDQFLRTYFELDATGWGSPFLLVPEATSVDEDTLQRIIQAKKSDFFLSQASPLGVPFNNLRTSSGEDQRKARIEKNRPGSPCYKKFLSFSTEFTEKPICTASRQYQNLKIKQKEAGAITQQDLDQILVKDCLCEGLSAPAILANGGEPKRKLNAVTICPGPNLAYFKGTFSLKEMVDRPHVFVKELQLYVTHLKSEMEKWGPEISAKQNTYLEKFKGNLQQGINYYRALIQDYTPDASEILDKMKSQLSQVWEELEQLQPMMEGLQNPVQDLAGTAKD
jgi:polyhydroxyalkanoate synthesis regulator phasin